MLLAEDLLLLLTDDASGRRLVDSTKTDLALAGAVVLELAQRGRVEVSPPGGPVRPGRLVVRDATPTGDPVLDRALSRLQEKGPRKPKDLLRTTGKGLHRELLARLVDGRVLRREEHRLLGLVPRQAHPTADPALEEALRRALHDVLVTGRPPSPREAALVSLLSAIDATGKVLGLSGAEKRAVRRRAKDVAEGEFAGEAVRRAVQEVASAVAAGAVVAVAAGSASG